MSKKNISTIFYLLNSNDFNDENTFIYSVHIIVSITYPFLNQTHV